MSTPGLRQTRQLHRGHFAFMRALLQGLDEKESWNRYLRAEGETADLRTIRHTIAWIRDAFAAAARREARPGTARLIRLDPERFSASGSLPTLEAFAAERGLEDFSEAEQAEAYAEAFPDASAGGGGRGRSGRPTQRSRVIAHQLAALRWLETHVAQDPRAGDDVRAWLNPAVAARLHRCGLRTLELLVARINQAGMRWWRHVPGVGVHKAARVVAWLEAHAHVAELRLQAHAVIPRQAMPPALRDGVVAPATALRPLEKFRVPSALDGRSGGYRAPAQQCLLPGANDPDAIAAWLRAKGDQGRTDVSATATWRAYRKEAERLLLWSVLVRAKPLSSLSSEDAREYCAFLAAPPPEWCGPRHHQRWSPQWRPLEGPLSPAARCHAVTVLRGLFAFLVRQNYVTENPFAVVEPPAGARRTLGANRSLSTAQWDRLEAQLGGQASNDPARAVARALRWLYATGLRLAEINAATCGDLERVEQADASGVVMTEWRLAVEGRGQRWRQVPVPAALVAELDAELSSQAACLHVQDPAARAIPILARFSGRDSLPQGWSCSGLAKAIKALFKRASARCGPDAAPLAKASAHWLRHSHGMHALKGSPVRLGLPLERVRLNLGHASRTTTVAYRTDAAVDAATVRRAVLRAPRQPIR